MSSQASSADAAARAIALAGFMGVGKSSIGRIAAAALGRPFFDSDAIVVERLGSSVAALFRAGEEARFRRYEAEAIAELVGRTPAPLIALGGGALLNRVTLDLLRERALLVHLYVPWESLEPVLPRLRRGRPLLEARSDEEIHELYLEREQLYANCPLTVELRRDGLEEGARALLAALQPLGIAPATTPAPERPLP